MKPSLTQQILSDMQQIPLESQDLARAGQHVLDWVACAMLGQKSEVARAYTALAVDLTQSGPCHFVGQLEALTGSWQNAISHNAALGNVLEMDDVHRQSILHPGPVVIPTALALAEHLNLSVNAFLRAVIVGYEFTIRVGERIGRSHYAYFHNTSTCGAFGAAMAAASLLELSDEQTLWALGNAGSRTGGLWQMRNENVMTKQWHNAEAARSGAMAAFLAQQGLTGPGRILEGPQGLFSAMSSDANISAVHGKSKTWKMYECSFKPWPACRHTHPAIDATLRLQSLHKFKADDVKEVHIFAYRDAAVFCDRVTPTTVLQAKFSLQHAVASVLLFGEPSLEHYALEAIDRPNTVDIRGRILVSVDEDVERKFPDHYGAKVQVILKNGKVLASAIRDTLGDPEVPMSEQQTVRKLHALLDAADVDAAKAECLSSFNWLKEQPIANLARYITQQSRTS